MSTSAPQGQISEGTKTSYEDAISGFTKAISKLTDLWDSGAKVKIEEGGDTTAKKQQGSGEKDYTKRGNKIESEEDEEDDEEEKKVEARRVLLRKIEARKRRLAAEARLLRADDEDNTQQAKLDELKAKIEEVKRKVEEAKRKREETRKMEAQATGKASVGEVREEKPQGGISIPNLGNSQTASGQPMPKYMQELLGQTKRFQASGQLSTA